MPWRTGLPCQFEPHLIQLGPSRLTPLRCKLLGGHERTAGRTVCTGGDGGFRRIDGLRKRLVARPQRRQEFSPEKLRIEVRSFRQHVHGMAAQAVALAPRQQFTPDDLSDQVGGECIAHPVIA